MPCPVASGSRQMAWLIHSRARKLLCGTIFKNRCTCVQFKFVMANGEGARSLAVVGCHLAHGEAFTESLTDMAEVFTAARKCDTTVVIGDFNVDELPFQANDPIGNSTSAFAERMGGGSSAGSSSGSAG